MEGLSIIMTVGGLLVTIVMVGGSIWFVMRLMGGMNREAKERERLLREGIQASARLMAVQMGGMTVTVGVHRHLQLQLQLEVTLQGPAYPVFLTTMVSELQIPQLQPGAMLTVRVDRNDPMKIALEGAGAPAPPAYGAPQPQGGFGPPQPQGASARRWAPSERRRRMARSRVTAEPLPTAPGWCRSAHRRSCRPARRSGCGSASAARSWASSWR